MTRAWAVALVLCGAARLAAADPGATPDPPPREAARAHHVRAQSLYDLGKFDEAIPEFEAGYRLDPQPAYLFNIAQAHRLAGRRDRALYFYRRYLELAPDAGNRADVEERIASLEAEQQAASASASAANRLRLGVEAGWAAIYFAGPTPDPGSQLAYRLSAAHVVPLGGFWLDLGGRYQLTSFPYVAMDGLESALYSQLQGVAALGRRIAGPVWASVALGAGLSVINRLDSISGLSKAESATFRLIMPCGRADLTLGYRLSATTDLTLGLLSASFARRNKNLIDEIRGVVTVELLLVGLRTGL